MEFGFTLTPRTHRKKRLDQPQAKQKVATEEPCLERIQEGNTVCLSFTDVREDLIATYVRPNPDRDVSERMLPVKETC